MTYEIEKTTARIINTLYRNGNPNKALLASLRDAPNMTSQRAQAVWPIMMANLDKLQLSTTGVPTPAEVAIYAAIRFYAIHQQGHQQTASVYEPADRGSAKGVTLFEALAELRKKEDTRVALDRRVQPLLATTNVTSVINELSHLIRILKANSGSQKIDYAQLAEDLFWLQASYEQATRVRVRWGQQYFWVSQTTDENEGAKTND